MKTPDEDRLREINQQLDRVPEGPLRERLKEELVEIVDRLMDEVQRRLDGIEQQPTLERGVSPIFRMSPVAYIILAGLLAELMLTLYPPVVAVMLQEPDSWILWRRGHGFLFGLRPPMTLDVGRYLAYSVLVGIVTASATILWKAGGWSVVGRIVGSLRRS